MTGGSCFTAWQAMLAEAEKEAKTHVELSQKLSQSVANQLSEITARKRVLRKKVRIKKSAICTSPKNWHKVVKFYAWALLSINYSYSSYARIPFCLCWPWALYKLTGSYLFNLEAKQWSVQSYDWWAMVTCCFVLQHYGNNFTHKANFGLHVIMSDPLCCYCTLNL